MDIQSDFIAAGGNRHPSAADWDSSGSGVIAYGSDCNIALWHASVTSHNGVYALLKGHVDHVNAIRFYKPKPLSRPVLLSASADGILLVHTTKDGRNYELLLRVSISDKPINALAITPEADFIVVASASSTISVWRLNVGDNASNSSADHVQDVQLPSKYLPLTASLHKLPGSDSFLLATGGTKSTVDLFTIDSQGTEVSHVANLSGHEGWIRSLDFKQETNDKLLLASASQDKYIRLWHINKGTQEISQDTTELTADMSLQTNEATLSNKPHQFEVSSQIYSVSFEALLLGHEDWIYTARWSNTPQNLSLLTASADNTIAVWEPEKTSGVWTCSVRLGELSAQKGATTATGSAGGFWIALWSEDDQQITTLGRTGSWRRWTLDTNTSSWVQVMGVGGHTKEVKDLAWSLDGSYALSTSSDQTTRQYSEWLHSEGSLTWHELSRPQIHGYDLNCIAPLSNVGFVSGADEKLLRVFHQPRNVGSHVMRLGGKTTKDYEKLPDAANLPVLGLSNKAVEAQTNITEDEDVTQQQLNEEEIAAAQTVEIAKLSSSSELPPFEEYLSRHLLWPEIEKLYGHGYEISAVASSHDGTLVATACRASSVEHAVIRIFETKTWREVKPALSGHNLTITGLTFSLDDELLLSVGRDRQLFIFKRQQEKDLFSLVASSAKAHSRMILGCSFAPTSFLHDAYVFATAGRDKVVKVWSLSKDYHLQEAPLVIQHTEPVTAVSFYSSSVDPKNIILAVGLENGQVLLLQLSSELTVANTQIVNNNLCPSKMITALSWRPTQQRSNNDDNRLQLSVASQDASYRILSVNVGQ